LTSFARKRFVRVAFNTLTRRTSMSSRDSRRFGRIVVAAAAVGFLACSKGGGGDSSPGDNVGVARIAITQAPADATCARIRIQGTSFVEKTFSLKPNDSTVFTISGIPVGLDKFSAETFQEGCAAVTPTSVPTWVSDPVSVMVPRGTPVNVTLKMHPNTGGKVSLDFPGATDGGANNADGGATTPPANTDPFALGEPSFPSLVKGDVSSLSPERRALLAKLNASSKVPVQLTLDNATGIVLVANLQLPGGVAGATSIDKARSFLDAYQALFDPLVLAAELVPAVTPPHCGEVAIVERNVNKVPVFGSRYTLHFNNDGDLIQVVNGVAPAPAKVIKTDLGGITTNAGPNVTNNNAVAAMFPGVAVTTLLPPGIPPTGIKTQAVLVPAPDHSGLVQATVATWSDASGDLQAYVVVGGKAVAPVRVPGHAMKGLLAGQPRFLPSAQTALADMISYRNVGGVATTVLPGEVNPVESTYRFMEEHPALLRTGDARCQMMNRDVDESLVTPGAQFVRMSQKYAGLPVMGAEVAVSLEQTSHILSVSGHTLPFIDLPSSTSIGSSTAISVAGSVLSSAAATHPEAAAAITDALAQTAATRLVVFPGPLTASGRTKPATALAWEVKRGAFTIVVDAIGGGVIYGDTSRHSSNVIADGEGRNEFGRLFYTTVDVDGVPTGALPLNADVVPARTALATTAAAYGALGFGGFGGNFRANTNVNISSGCLNAFFDSTFTNEGYFCLGMGMDDVIGHEMTHGVIAHTSGLVYRDEPGAVNESYADLMGNLFFPDGAGGTAMLVGELTAGGAIRDMQTPGNFGQPGHISMFKPRDSTCDLFPWSCDNGFVHTNSGILNRAQWSLVMGVPSVTTGIGRAKMRLLSFITMTTRLTPMSRLNDISQLTRDVCDMFVSRGVTDGTGTAFVNSDCDQIPIAFNQVGLDPALSTGWSEPSLGFDGVDNFFTDGTTTPTGCNVTNVTATLNTLSGAQTIDLDPATPLPSSTNYLLVTGIDLRNPPNPIGTPSKFHSLHWYNIFGVKPSFATQVIVAPPPMGAPDCVTPIGFLPIQRTSGSIIHTFGSDPFGGSGTDVIGNASSGMNPACVVNNVQVEILADDGSGVTNGPGVSVTHTDHFMFWDFNKVVTLLNSGPRTLPNLTGTVNWSHDTGQSVRYRLRYFIDKPSFVADCIP
jgi:thermolysin